MILQSLFNGLALGSLYSIVALGFGLIYTTTKIFHVAHAAVFTIAAYLFYTLAIIGGLNIYLSALLGILGSALIGILIEVCNYRFLEKKKASLAAFLMSSLGVYILLQNAVSLIYGNQNRFIHSETPPVYSFWSLVMSQPQFWQILVGLCVLGGMYFFLEKTGTGKDMKAFANNPKLAEILGFHIPRLRLMIFTIGSSLAGLGAVLSANDVGLDPHFGLSIILVSVVSVTIGGMGGLLSGVLGGYFVGLIQGMVSVKIPAQWESSILFCILIIFLLTRPYGIVGKKRRAEELMQ